ncbi:hypothetical protein [Tomitella fengzijianii]|uniref:Uncharacterized protein n=1 Tax=Tomitella fengzijianii TaxID=2597660 RepID=A0A516X6P3_9ACTN|nr:hypothetical protein [Tomitella fengzijianii]QDQ98725.1 hypothetical protein FO059_17045 [Tomitella fengzijianii]
MTGSILDALGSIDASSLAPLGRGSVGIVENVFAAISGALEVGVSGSGALAGLIDSGLASSASA